MTDPLKLHTPTEAEQLIDRVMVAGTGVMKALESKDIAGNGMQWAMELAQIASRAEAQFMAWRHERKAQKA